VTILTRREAATHRRRRDRYRIRIMRQLRRLGYRPRTWREAVAVARRLTRRRR